MATAGCADFPGRPAFVSLRLFLRHYFPQTYWQAWGRDRLAALKAIEAGICGRHAATIHLNRGRGKSSIILGTAIWVVTLGLRPKVTIVCPNRAWSEAMGMAVVGMVGFSELANDVPGIADRVRDAIVFAHEPGTYALEDDELVLLDLLRTSPIQVDRNS